LKLGLYGGTFDPVHLAHLIIADIACEELHLDRLIFMPCAAPPHKYNPHLTNGDHRLRMLELAIAGHAQFSCSDLEIRQGGTSYTVDTVTRLRDEYNLEQKDFYLIIGADNLKEFHTWKQPQQIIEICRLAVAARPDYLVDDTPGNLHPEVTRLTVPLLEISSTMIRQRVQQDKSVTFFVPGPVLDYIRHNGLYRR